MVEYIIDDNFGQYSQNDNGKFVTAIFTPNSINEFSHFGRSEYPQYDYMQEDDNYLDQDNINFAVDTLALENLIKTYDNAWENDETNDVGDYVQDYDLQLWNPSNSTNNYIETQNSSNPNFDTSAASQYLLKHANSKSTHRCAAYVRQGLQAGGVNMDDRPRKAGQYLAYFRRKPQWTEINPSEVQQGDVCVTVNSGDGHISMWTGQNWVSDFIQRGPHVYTYAIDGKNTFYFRYTG